MAWLTNAQLLRWRTVIIILAAMVVLLVAYLVGLRHPGAAALFPAMATALCALAGVGATKSAIEHLGNGGGLKGALTNLLTDAKPEPKP